MPRRGQRRAALAVAPAIALGLLLAATAPAAHARAFTGAWLKVERVGLAFNGTAYPRVSCPPYTPGFCRGRISIVRRGTVVGRSPLALRSNDTAGVQVPMRGESRRAVMAGGRRVTVVIATHATAAPGEPRWSVVRRSAVLTQ